MSGLTETQSVPASVRAAVLERDGSSCRLCGAAAKHPAIHHIFYESQGGSPTGRHVMENLVTVHWMYEPRCHETIHSNKRLWQPVLAEVVKHDGLTAYELMRRVRRSWGRPR